MKKRHLALVLALVMMVTTLAVTTTPVLAATPTANSFTRIAGQNRYETATAIASMGNVKQLTDVIIASGNNFPDALSVSVLAKKLNAPVLLVDSTVADSNDAFDFMTSNLSKSAIIHIVGGTGVISTDFEIKLKSLGFSNLDRIGGADRYATDTLIAQKLDVPSNTPVVIAAGENFPDALSISSIASSKGYPILLTGKDSISEGVEDFLVHDNPSQVYLVGGTGVISEAVESTIHSLVSTTVTRIAGTDRFDTAAKVLAQFSLNPKTVYIASGLDFPDALAGSALASLTGDPIVLTGSLGSRAPAPIGAYLQTLYSTNVSPSIVAFGGAGVVADSTLADVVNVLAGAPPLVIEATSSTLLRGLTVAVDPGHGGADVGAIGYSGTYEKNNTLAVGLKLADLLKAAGAKVILTRTGDAPPTGSQYTESSDLQARVDIANDGKADLFVSIHNDSFTNPAAGGTSTYYNLNNPQSDKGKTLAQNIQNQVLQQFGLNNRGVNNANFYVIKYTNMPAVLVEIGFISNQNEEQILCSPDDQQKAALGIFRGILAYKGLLD